MHQHLKTMHLYKFASVLFVFDPVFINFWLVIYCTILFAIF